MAFHHADFLGKGHLAHELRDPLGNRSGGRYPGARATRRALGDRVGPRGLGGRGRNNYQPSQRCGGDGRHHASLMVSPASQQDIRIRHLAASNVRRTQIPQILN
jgi:hypothetical protein